MRFTFNPDKDAVNVAKHGISFAQAEVLEWDSAVTWTDDRRDYGEARQCAIGYIGVRLYLAVFVDRQTGRHSISLRKANLREERRYANT